MELRVESVDGCVMPPGAYVGVRVGDVLKQGRYEPQRCYNFPAPQRRRNAKIDIFRHVGSGVVSIDPDLPKMCNDVTISSLDPEVSEIKLKVNVQATTGDPQKQKEAKSAALKNYAKEYLSQHRIEEKLSEAVRALLKEQPVDPIAFICTHLVGDEPIKSVQAVGLVASKISHGTAQVASVLPFRAYYKEHVIPGPSLPYMKRLHAKFPCPPSCSGPTTTASSGAAPKGAPISRSTVDGLRSQARDVLFKASVDGHLQYVLADVRGQAPLGECPSSFQSMPSVGTWLTSNRPKVIDTSPKSSVSSFVRLPSVGTWYAAVLPT